MSRIYLFDQLPFDQLTQAELFDQVLAWMEKKKNKRHFLLNMNAFGVVTYFNNQSYRELMNQADLVISDGWGPVFASRLNAKNGQHLKNRLNVGDFLLDLLTVLAKNKKTVFLIGAREKNLQAAKKKIEEVSGIRVVGQFNGYFSPAAEKDILKQIELTQPDLVLLGLGVPKQEEFLWCQRANLPASVYMVGGGVFNYLAGDKKRAPVWMRNSGLEWLFRLIQEPFRLFWRYTAINLFFLYYTLSFYLKSKLKLGSR